MSTPRRFFLGFVAALGAASAALGPAGDARGAPAAATTPAAPRPCAGSVDESRRHMERGFALYDRKQFLEAAAEFDAAYRAQAFSAFLCNAAMAYQEGLDFPTAILRYRAFLAAEPNPPDLARLKATLTWLEAQNAAQIAARADGGAPDTVGEPAPTTPPPAEMTRSFRSQVIVVSDPPDAPLTVWARRAGTAPFAPSGPNPGWEKAVSGVRTPHDLSLGAGTYHVVIDAFKDYRRSETDLELVPGRLYEFKANLSQGEFMGFLRVLAPSASALVFVDDPPPHRRPPWGRAPGPRGTAAAAAEARTSMGALIESGAHQVWVEAPGYEPHAEKVVVEHGRTVEIAPALVRVAHGYLRVDGNAPEVTISIDGTVRGIYSSLGEPARLRLPGGRHLLSLAADGRKTWSGDVDVPRGQEMGVHGRFSFKPPRSSAIATGALAVGAVVGGVALFREAGQPQTVAPGMAPTNAPTYFRVGGVVAFGVGALLGASTVYGLVSDPTPPSRVVLDTPTDLAADDSLPPPPSIGPRGRIFGAEAAVTTDACRAL